MSENSENMAKLSINESEKPAETPASDAADAAPTEVVLG